MQQSVTSIKRTALALAFAVAVAAPVSAVDSPIKKTLDGRCLTPEHPDYWDTNVYIAKPSMDACLKSGGRPAGEGE